MSTTPIASHDFSLSYGEPKDAVNQDLRITITISHQKIDDFAVLAEQNGFDSIQEFASHIFQDKVNELWIKYKKESVKVLYSYAKDEGIDLDKSATDTIFSREYMEQYRSFKELYWLEDPRFNDSEGRVISMLNPFDKWSNYETRLVAGELTESMLSSLLSEECGLPQGNLKDDKYYSLAEERLSSCIKDHLAEITSKLDRCFDFPVVESTMQRIADNTDCHEIAGTWLSAKRARTPFISGSFRKRGWNE